MLGLRIKNMPIIMPDEHLPEGVAGEYHSVQNLVRIRPTVERDAVAVLAHELAHAWWFQEGGSSEKLMDDTWPESGKFFVEGFAQWVEVKALDYFGFEVEVARISGWPPDAYGIGFRLFNSLEEGVEQDENLPGFGAHGVISFVQDPTREEYRTWLDRYFGGLVYRTDLAEIRRLVEAGKGPPPDWSQTETKGPLEKPPAGEEAETPSEDGPGEPTEEPAGEAEASLAQENETSVDEAHGPLAAGHEAGAGAPADVATSTYGVAPEVSGETAMSDGNRQSLAAGESDSDGQTVEFHQRPNSSGRRPRKKRHR